MGAGFGGARSEREEITTFASVSEARSFQTAACSRSTNASDTSYALTTMNSWVPDKVIDAYNSCVSYGQDLRVVRTVNSQSLPDGTVEQFVEIELANRNSDTPWTVDPVVETVVTCDAVSSRLRLVSDSTNWRDRCAHEELRGAQLKRCANTGAVPLIGSRRLVCSRKSQEGAASPDGLLLPPATITLGVRGKQLQVFLPPEITPLTSREQDLAAQAAEAQDALTAARAMIAGKEAEIDALKHENVALERKVSLLQEKGEAAIDDLLSEVHRWEGTMKSVGEGDKLLPGFFRGMVGVPDSTVFLHDGRGHLCWVNTTDKLPGKLVPAPFAKGFQPKLSDFRDPFGDKLDPDKLPVCRGLPDR
jgi:hypothetical protein